MLRFTCIRILAEKTARRLPYCNKNCSVGGVPSRRLPQALAHLTSRTSSHFADFNSSDTFIDPQLWHASIVTSSPASIYAVYRSPSTRSTPMNAPGSTASSPLIGMLVQPVFDAVQHCRHMISTQAKAIQDNLSTDRSSY